MDRGRKAIWGWAFYDWANSAFATTVMAGFFPIFFKQYWSIGTDINTSTAQLGLGNSIASLAVALSAPILGAIADRSGLRKKFLLMFAYLGILMTTALFMVGKFAAILGPALMGIIGITVKRVLLISTPYPAQMERISTIATRASIGSVLLLFLAGGLLLYFVKEIPE